MWPSIGPELPQRPYSLRDSGTPKNIVRIGKLHEALCRMLSVTYFKFEPKKLI